MEFVDSLWEFVLEDSEDEEKADRRRKSEKSKADRQRKSSESSTKNRISIKNNKRNDKSDNRFLDPNYFNIFDSRKQLQDESDVNHDKTWKMGWFDGRDDNDESNTKQSKRSSISRSMCKDSERSTGSGSLKNNRSGPKNSKHENRTDNREDKEDGFWDILTGAPPVATIPKRSISSNSKGRSLLPIRRNDEESNRKSTTIVLQSKAFVRSTSIASTGSAKSKTSGGSEKKKRSFKKHFKLNSDLKPSGEESFKNKYYLQDLEVKHIALEKDDREKDIVKSSTEDDTVFDPMMSAIFQIADSFDPWGQEEQSETSNSDTDTCPSETAGNDDDADEYEYELDTREPNSSRSKRIETQESQSLESSSSHIAGDRTNDRLESLLDQPLPEPIAVDPSSYPYHSDQASKQESEDSSEIGLQVNPLGNTLSEELYKVEKNIHNNNVEPDAQWEEYWASTPRLPVDPSESRPIHSFGGISKKSGISMKDIATEITDNEDAAVLNDGVDRSSPSSDEIKIPRDVHIKNIPSSNDGGREGRDIENTTKRNLLKKVICGLKKASRNDLIINRLKKTDAAEVFPSSRMIVDGETHSIIGQNIDLVNGVMGVPSDHLVQSSGPQSLYEYDYDSNENMNVSYTKSNQKARGNISVRSLGPPRSLSWSLGGENIVIQVEVRNSVQILFVYITVWLLLSLSPSSSSFLTPNLVSCICRSIQASTVSQTDCIIRQGLWWGDSEPSFPNTPGVDVVGKVYSVKQTTGNAYGLQPKQTVVSLVKWGGNSRFVTIHPNQLVKVADGLDPAQVACLPEAYLSAFQVLHKNQAGSLRYRENSLKGKSILILGCMTNNMGRAMIDLALNAGVATIYATAKKKHWKKLLSIGVMPLSTDPMEWIQNISGTISLVLAPNGNLREDVSPVHFRALLPKYGQLIICGRRIVGNDIPITEWKRDHQTSILACGQGKALQKILGNSSTYDVYEEWERNLELCKKDLSHLLKLLERKIIKPEVLDRLPLNKVAKAQELLELKRLPGFLVCEPWMMSKKRAVYL